MGNICKSSRQDVIVDAQFSCLEPKQLIQSLHKSASLLELQELSEAQQLRDRRKKIVSCSSTTNEFEMPGTAVNRGMSEHERAMVKICMIKHSLLSNLEVEIVEALIDHMKLLEFEQDTVIFEQGNIASHFYVVAAGRLENIVNSQKQSELVKGNYFGEHALHHTALRPSTVRALDRSLLWALDREVFRHTLVTAASKNYEENLQFINSVQLFNCLTPTQMSLLGEALKNQQFKPGHAIVREGLKGDLFFIIKEGEVSCTQGGSELRRMGRGEFFGEQALIYNTVRTATVTALTDVKCTFIGRDMLTNVLGSQLSTIIYRNSLKMALEKNSYMSRLNNEQIDAAVRQAELKTISLGGEAFTASALGQVLVILLKGKITGPLQLKKFDIVGDAEMFDDVFQHLEGQFIAETDIVIATITKDQIKTAIGGEFRSAVEYNDASMALLRIPFLRSLSIDQKQSLIPAVSMMSFQEGTFLFQAGDPASHLYIVKSGSAYAEVDSVPIRFFFERSIFGQRGLLTGLPRSVSLRAHTDLVCWTISHDVLFGMLDARTIAQLEYQSRLQDHTIKFENLKPVRLLGKGSFGTVLQVEHQDCMYALKGVCRSKVLKYDLYESLQLEREILLQIDHPFIMKLAKTFKNKDRIFFLTEYISGVDMFDHMIKAPMFPEAKTRFYVACLLSALKYIHKRNIVYRDLKPENIIIDAEGYLKIIDFGTSKKLKDRTFTLVGTPHYMAPEVITYAGYGCGADYWSLGVLMFEMLNGFVPFGENKDDPYEIYETVMQGKIPVTEVTQQMKTANDIISKLLNKNPAVRVGAAEGLFTHHWFKVLDLVSSKQNDLEDRHIEAPFIPRVEVCVPTFMHLTVQQAFDLLDPPPKSKRVKIGFENWDLAF